jgi:WD40 repeat protein
MPFFPTTSLAMRLKVWEVGTARKVLDHSLSPSYIAPTLTWSPDGRKLAVGHMDSPGLPGFRVPTPLEGPAGVLSALVLSVDRVYKFRVWDIAKGREAATFPASFKRLRHPVFSSDGGLLLAPHGKGWTVWNTETGRAALALPEVELAAEGKFSPDGRCLATVEHRFGNVGDRPGKNMLTHELLLREVATGQILVRRSLPAPTTLVHALRFRPDGNALVLFAYAATEDGKGREWTASLWAAADGWKGRTVRGMPLPLQREDMVALAFSKDSRSLAIGLGKDLWLCDAATGETLHTLRNRRRTVIELFFTAEGKRLFVVSLDEVSSLQEVHLWDVDTGRQRLTLPLRPGFAGTLASFRFAGSRLFAANWSVEGFPEVQVFDGSPVSETNGP